jgi:hypothetical protein
VDKLLIDRMGPREWAALEECGGLTKTRRDDSPKLRLLVCLYALPDTLRPKTPFKELLCMIKECNPENHADSVQLQTLVDAIQKNLESFRATSPAQESAGEPARIGRRLAAREAKR